VRRPGLLVLLVLRGAAHGDASVPPVSGPAPGKGEVRGTVEWVGAAPEMPMLRRDADPYCARTPLRDETLVVNPNHTVRNVVVRVQGVAGTWKPPETPVIVRQEKCMYWPRVQAALAGQALQIDNGDRTLHNVHAYAGPTTLWNRAQIPGSPYIQKALSGPGDVLRLRCDVHPWMAGYVVTSDNPFYAVTGDDGSFVIRDLPPGSYRIVAWHEQYGAKTLPLTVGAGQVTRGLRFQYSRDDYPTPRLPRGRHRSTARDPG
jgi:hypothetical protein